MFLEKLKKRKVFLLVPVLVTSFSTNFYLIKANAAWNHLVSSQEWANPGSVTYDFDNSTYPTTAAIQQAVHDSMYDWAAVSSKVAVKYSSLSLNDWYYKPIDDLGETTITYNRDTNKISEVNTVMDSTVSGGWHTAYLSPCPSTKQDYKTVVLHEAGHWWRLNDDYSHPAATMDGENSPGEVDHSLSQEDKDALIYMYGN